jgi:hypothetical protein
MDNLTVVCFGDFFVLLCFPYHHILLRDEAGRKLMQAQFVSHAVDKRPAQNCAISDSTADGGQERGLARSTGALHRHDSNEVPPNHAST